MKTIDETRRDNLVIAIGRFRTATALAEAAATSAAYLSQVKNRQPDSKTGEPKGMGDDVARRIEKALGESEGWMDVDHSGNSSTAGSDGSPDGWSRLTAEERAAFQFLINAVLAGLVALPNTAPRPPTSDDRPAIE